MRVTLCQYKVEKKKSTAQDPDTRKHRADCFQSYVYTPPLPDSLNSCITFHYLYSLKFMEKLSLHICPNTCTATQFFEMSNCRVDECGL
jgi:hypothetical protein